MIELSNCNFWKWITKFATFIINSLSCGKIVSRFSVKTTLDGSQIKTFNWEMLGNPLATTLNKSKLPFGC